MNVLCFLFCLAFQINSPNANQEIPSVDLAYKAQIKKLFQATNLENSFHGSIAETISIYKKQNPKIPVKFWSELQAECSGNSLDQLTDLFAPIYIKYLDQNDLAKILLFYDSPTGKKYATNSPKIMKETILIGQNWAMEIQNLIFRRMVQKGYVKDELH